jgi:hypothetical protein
MSGENELSDDEILQEELGKLGMLGGSLGGVFGGALSTNLGDGVAGDGLGVVGGFLGGGAGGRLGAHWAAKRLPTHTAAREVELPLNPEAALRLSLTTLTTLGKLVRDRSDDPVPALSGVISGPGLLHINPAVVTIQIAKASETATTLRISAAAKEGLIKQNTAAKAVARVVATLTSL